MAWALRAGTPANTTRVGTGSLTLTLGAACSVDDRVIVSVTANSNAGTPSVDSISGTFCGTFTKDSTTTQFTTGSFHGIETIWSAPVTSAGTPVLTIGVTAGSGGSSAGGAAFSGLSNAATSAAVDVSAANQKDAGVDALPTVTTGSTSAANELVVGGAADDGNTLSFTAGSGYTSPAAANVSGGNADEAFEYKDSGGIGTQVVNGTWSATTEWGMAAVVYKLAASSGNGYIPRVVLAGIRRGPMARALHMQQRWQTVPIVVVDTNLQPAAAAMVLAGLAPQLKESTAPAIATLTLTGIAPQLQEKLSPAIATLTLSGQTPSIVNGTVVSPSIGAMTLTGVAPQLRESLAPVIGTLTFSGQTPNINVGTNLQPIVGTLVLTGATPTVTFTDNQTFTPIVATMTFTGIAPDVQNSGATPSTSPEIIFLLPSGRIAKRITNKAYLELD